MGVCSCPETGFGVCTLIYCPPEEYGEAECRECADGYTLSNGECVEERCGGFVGCTSYFDGCNVCGCPETGFGFCTLIFCPDEQYGEPECRECDDGYTLSNGECVEETTSNPTT